MKTNLLTVSAIVICIVMASLNAKAQDGAKKYDDPQWKSIVYVDFKNGKAGRAREIIADYYVKSAVKAGTAQPEVVLTMATGKWDMVLIWGMKDGLEQLNWETSPDNIKWRKAFNEIAGGEDKGKAILDEYSACVASAKREIGRQRQ